MALNVLDLLCINMYENDQSGVFLCLEVSISFTALVGAESVFVIEVCQCFLSFSLSSISLYIFGCTFFPVQL